MLYFGLQGESARLEVATVVGALTWAARLCAVQAALRRLYRLDHLVRSSMSAFKVRDGRSIYVELRTGIASPLMTCKADDQAAIMTRSAVALATLNSKISVIPYLDQRITSELTSPRGRR